MAIAQLFKDLLPRRCYGECQRCQRVDYLPWATEHGLRYCGQCWEADALAYAKDRNLLECIADLFRVVGDRRGFSRLYSSRSSVALCGMDYSQLRSG